MEKEGNNRKMHMVIDIPEKLACEGFERPFTEEEKNILIKAIGNGTPLPKRHGRILVVLEDIIKRELIPLNFSCQKWVSEVGLSNATFTIIEAESEDEE